MAEGDGNKTRTSRASRASRATPSAANRGVQARPGDATGKENERLRKENEAALKEASQSMTLVNPPPVVEETDTVVDYTQGGNAHTGGGEGGARLITMDEATADGTQPTSLDIAEEDTDLDALPTGEVGAPAPEVVQHSNEPQPAAGARQDSQQHVRTQEEQPPAQPASPAPQQPPAVEQRPAPVVEQAHRMLRVNTDLEDITIGKDNHYTFFVGQPYKVPAHVYDHLAEKGYVLR